jgi:hypothetical protein
MREENSSAIISPKIPASKLSLRNLVLKVEKSKFRIQPNPRVRIAKGGGIALVPTQPKQPSPHWWDYNAASYIGVAFLILLLTALVLSQIEMSSGVIFALLIAALGAGFLLAGIIFLSINANGKYSDIGWIIFSFLLAGFSLGAFTVLFLQMIINAVNHKQLKSGSADENANHNIRLFSKAMATNGAFDLVAALVVFILVAVVIGGEDSVEIGGFFALYALAFFAASFFTSGLLMIHTDSESSK